MARARVRRRYDFNFGFYLQRLEGADEAGGGAAPTKLRQIWHFRAPSEAMRLVWAEKLTIATHWAAQELAAGRM